MIIDSFESLNSLKLPEDIKVVSFDIFDTILIRKVDPPEKTKELACQKAVGDGIVNRSVAELLALRNKIEEGLKRRSQSEGKDREFSVRDAFSEAASSLGEKNKEEFIAKMLDIELEVEKVVAAAMPGIKDILNSLSKRLPLIAVSETYLHPEMLHRLLEHLDLNRYFNKIYASSFYKASKSSGRLFKYILDEERIDANELLHVGDNFLSDYFVPKKMGIIAVCLNDGWNFSRKCSVRIADKLGNRRRFWSNYSDLLNLVSAEKPSQSKSDLLHNFGYTFAGPLLTIFTHLLLLEVREKKIDNIFFIARDGFMLKRIFSLFASADGFDTHYLCISRYTAVLASVAQLTEREWRYTVRLAVTAGEVLERLGVAADDAASFLNQYHLSHDSRIAVSSTTEALRKLFGDPEFSQSVLEKTALMRDRLRRYLSQRDFMNSNRVALVDIGWRGVIQDCLVHSFGDSKELPEIHGYYLALNPPVLPTQTLKYGLLYDYRHTSPEEMFLSFSKELLELSSKASHGTTVDYAESASGKMMPVFGKALNGKASEGETDSDICCLQKGIIDFAKNYLDYFKITGSNPRELRYAAIKLYDRLAGRPVKEHIDAVNRITYSDDFGTSRSRNIIGRFSYTDLLRPGKFIKEFSENLWREAALKSSGMSAMNFLYYVAKRITCCYRIIRDKNA